MNVEYNIYFTELKKTVTKHFQGKPLYVHVNQDGVS